MKHLKIFESYFKPLQYSGGDVTRMSIIGKVITHPIGSYGPSEYDIVEIIDSPNGKIYVANMWYKEWKRIPQLIHSQLVQEYIPKVDRIVSKAHNAITRIKGSEYAPTSNEIQSQIDRSEKTITCENCGWSWKLEDGGNDPYVCHKCGHNNSKN